jgi:hypothetical protein
MSPTIPREYLSLPEGEEVPTKYGKVVIKPTNGVQVYIDANSNGKKLTVRGVEYSVTFHAQDYGNGMEPFRDQQGRTHHALYASRAGHMRDVSDAARRSLTEELTRVAREYAATEQGRAALALAGKVDHNNRAQRIEEEICKLERELATKRTELATTAPRCPEVSMGLTSRLGCGWSMGKGTWGNDGIQFPRLLAEINAVGLTTAQIKALCVSMDLQPAQITELLERAECEWEALKDRSHEPPEYTPSARAYISAMMDAANDTEVQVLSDVRVRAGLLLKCSKCGWLNTPSDARKTNGYCWDCDAHLATGEV